jgi:hypothetical protein
MLLVALSHERKKIMGIQAERTPLAAVPLPHKNQVPKNQVVNLTEQLVVKEADALIATCNAHPERQIFAHPAERQRLIRYALNRVNKVYLLVQHPHQVQRHYEPVIAQIPAVREALREGMQTITRVYLKKPKRPNPLRSLSPLSAKPRSTS